MAKTVVGKIYQANFYINGNTFLGQAKEFSIPTIENNMEDFVSVGLPGSISLASGKNSIESRVAWNAPNKIAWRYAADTETTYDFMIKGGREDYTTGNTTVMENITCFMRGRFRQTPNLDYTGKADATSETAIDVYSLKVEIDGVSYLEYDPLAYIYTVNGIDKLAAMRIALGL